MRWWEPLEGRGPVVASLENSMNPGIDLAHRQVGGVGVRVSADVPRCGELRDCDATIDPLARLLEDDESAIDVLEGDEARLGGGWSHPRFPSSFFF
jgi:hypothetical protein